MLLTYQLRELKIEIKTLRILFNKKKWGWGFEEDQTYWIYNRDFFAAPNFKVNCFFLSNICITLFLYYQSTLFKPMRLLQIRKKPIFWKEHKNCFEKKVFFMVSSLKGNLRICYISNPWKTKWCSKILRKRVKHKRMTRFCFWICKCFFSWNVFELYT